MKKILSVLLLVVLLTAMSPRARATEEEAFYLDREAVFSNMDRPYAQGYTPTVAWGRVMLALPVRSDRVVGEIQAELLIDDDISPFRTPVPLPRIKPVEPGFWAVSFHYAFLTDYKNGDYPCVARITGKDAAGETLSTEFPTVIHIRDGESNPEALLIHVADKGSALSVGEEGTVSVTLSNPGRTVGFEALSLTVSDPSGDILPRGQDTVVLGDLMPGESLDLSFPVTVAPSARVTPHALRLDFSGQSLGRAVKLSVNYTVPVRQEIRLEQGGLRMAESVVAGDSMTVTLPLMNMGKADVVNAMATLSLPGITERQSVLVGTIQPGETRQAQLTLTVPKSALGESSGALTVSCEDNDGNTVSFDLPVRLTVEEAVQTEALDTQNAARRKTPASVIVLSAVCAALSLALIAQGILLRGKLHRLEEERL